MAKQKPDKIKVDKNFLMEILGMIKKIQGDVDAMKKTDPRMGSTESVKDESGSLPDLINDSIFACQHLMSIEQDPPSPEEAIIYKQNGEEFQKKLKVLMEQYKIVQLTATILKKL